MRGLCLPAQGSKAEGKAAWTKVLGSHQRQNTEGLESIKKDPEPRETKHLLEQEKEHDQQVGQSIQALTNCGPNKQPNPVTKHVGMCGGSEKAEKATKEKSSGAEFTEARTQLREGRGLPQNSFELSFQENSGAGSVTSSWKAWSLESLSYWSKLLRNCPSHQTHRLS